ncbi:XVIPCD domain-containing protein [Xanthomonas campestris]|uniref:XVIPCD domain-containing protein n=1 Tax=Xanthomonas campestris TaxID=339 RepID=UPI001EDD2010|nr:XVIPCD domain-containing protein [Xanthomonas campestris]
MQKKVLKGFAPLNDPHAGGTYDPRDQEIHLPLAALVNDANGKHAAAGDLTFVLGHEIQHSLYSPTAALAREQFKTEAIKIARSTHDYTAAGEKVLASNRADEATAEIAGWNAIVSAAKSRNPNPTLEDVYLFADGRARDFVTRSGYPSVYTLKANLTFNSDLTLSPTAANVEAMGVNYFDKSVKDTRIGHAGQSDYVNHYGPWVVGTAAIYERHYNKSKPGEPEQPMILDMQRLGFKEEILEHNGVDLGSDTRPMPYLDSSTQPPTPGLFQHSKDTHLHVSPISAQELEQELRARESQSQGTSAQRLPSDPGHADHALYQQIRGGVQKLDSAHGREWDASSERMTASLLALAKEEGLSRVDHVVLNNPMAQLAGGEKVFVVQGALDDPAHRRAHMPTVDALQTPESQSFERLQAINQTQAQAREQQQALEQSQQAVSQAGPSMTR